MHYKIIAIDPDFTFHSGYIQIIWPHCSDWSVWRLYIPIWLYSNRLATWDKTKLFTSLHSNLVIFKFLKAFSDCEATKPLHSNLVIFKFPMFPRNYCPIYLYIPIWFYSNFNISLVHFGNFIFFTFQSGSIQIKCKTLSKISVRCFTFQSGSIQMETNNGLSVDAKIFTFQSGYIQIFFLSSRPLRQSSLHSNLVLFK